MSTPKYLSKVQVIEGQGADLQTWSSAHQPQLVAGLRQAGAVLLRGFSAKAETTADGILSVLSNELLEDAFWSTPRSGVAQKTFTATEYPKERTIVLHSEMAYMAKWPRLLAFHSIIAATRGGETTLCDLDEVSRAMGPLLAPFAEFGVMYRRTYHTGVDIPWQKAFRTAERSEVERIARQSGMAARWLDSETLQTSHRAQGCVAAEDGTPLWFNQAHVFHSSNLPANQRASLLEMFGEDQLPRQALYGNGEPIADRAVDSIQQLLREHTFGVEWRPEDVLLVDNMRFMHGRAPFEGERKLHVAMATAQSAAQRTPVCA